MAIRIDATDEASERHLDQILGSKGKSNMVTTNMFAPEMTVVIDLKMVRSDNEEVTVRLKGGVGSTLGAAKALIESTAVAWKIKGER